MFQKKLEEKYERYYNNVNSGLPTNLKNNSSGVKGIFGSGGGIGGTGDDNNNDSSKYYDGLLPNLNMSKRECKSFLHE